MFLALFFRAGSLDLLRRRPEMPLNRTFFLLLQFFPEDVLIFCVGLGEIVKAKALRGFQFAPAFPIALDQHIDAPLNFGGWTLPAAAEILVVFNLQLSNLLFECSQFFVNGGHARGETSKVHAKAMAENRHPEEGEEGEAIRIRYRAAAIRECRMKIGRAHV